jgi:hypothetical protein
MYLINDLFIDEWKYYESTLSAVLSYNRRIIIFSGFKKKCIYLNFDNSI